MRLQPLAGSIEDIQPSHAGILWYNATMTDFGKIAGRFAERRATFATPKAPKPDGIEISYRILFRYPTVVLMCVLPVMGLVMLVIFGLILIFKTAVGH